MFLNGCHFGGVRQNDKNVMFPLNQTISLKGQALQYFMDTVSYEAAGFEDAARMPEGYFLSDGAKRVNDEIWMYQNFILVKMRRSKNQDIYIEAVLNEFITHISHLSDI